MSSTQLLYQSAPFQAAILFVSGPLVDQFLTRKNVFAYKYSSIVLVLIYPIPISLLVVFSCSDYIYIHERVTESNIYQWKTLQAFIILSCIISVSVNFSTFMVIGKTSPVTYQVLGHLKTCLVLGFGYTLLHDPFTMRNIIGILVAIFGMGLYSYFCVQENKKKQSVDLSLASQVLYAYYRSFDMNISAHYLGIENKLLLLVCFRWKIRIALQFWACKIKKPVMTPRNQRRTLLFNLS